MFSKVYLIIIIIRFFILSRGNQMAGLTMMSFRNFVASGYTASSMLFLFLDVLKEDAKAIRLTLQMSAPGR